MESDYGTFRHAQARDTAIDFCRSLTLAIGHDSGVLHHMRHRGEAPQVLAQQIQRAYQHCRLAEAAAEAGDLAAFLRYLERVRASTLAIADQFKCLDATTRRDHWSEYRSLEIEPSWVLVGRVPLGAWANGSAGAEEA